MKKHHTIQIRPSGVNFLALLTICMSCQQAWGQTPWVELRFNNDTPAVLSTGAEHCEGQFLDGDGQRQNLHSQDAGGVSGEMGDLAFDNSASEMSYIGGIAVLPQPLNIPPVVGSFTITGWFNMGGSQQGFQELARLVRLMGPDSGFDLGLNKGLRLDLRIKGNTGGTNDEWAISEPLMGQSFAADDQWVFFAAVYDSSAKANQVIFYSATFDSQEVEIVSAHSFTSCSDVRLESHRPIEIGNADPKSRIRAFSGFLDNIRIFTSETSAEGALDVETLQKIYSADVLNQGIH